MTDEKNKNKIVKNTTEGYGYKYSSLADLARAGVRIPKMRIRPLDGREYVEYLDDKGEWQLGARIVVPEMKNMNAAQAYGSALTYARRYTVQLAESVACDDDKEIENAAPAKTAAGAKPPRLDLARFKAEVEKQETDDDIRRFYASYKAKMKLTDGQKKILEKICGEVIKNRAKRTADVLPSEEEVDNFEP